MYISYACTIENVMLSILKTVYMQVSQGERSRSIPADHLCCGWRPSIHPCCLHATQIEKREQLKSIYKSLTYSPISNAEDQSKIPLQSTSMVKPLHLPRENQEGRQVSRLTYSPISNAEDQSKIPLQLTSAAKLLHLPLKKKGGSRSKRAGRLCIIKAMVECGIMKDDISNMGAHM
jgi:hypothetical protein